MATRYGSKTNRTTANATALALNFSLVDLAAGGTGSVADGDFLVLTAETRSVAQAGTLTLDDASFIACTPAVSDSTASHQHRTWRKVWRTGDPTTVNFSITTSFAIAAALVVERPDSGQRFSVVLESMSDSATQSNTPTDAGITTPQDDTVVITCYGINDGTATLRTPMTLNGSQTKAAEVATSGSAVGMALCVAREARATAGATGTRNPTLAGGNTSAYSIFRVVAAEVATARWRNIGTGHLHAPQGGLH